MLYGQTFRHQAQLRSRIHYILYSPVSWQVHSRLFRQQAVRCRDDNRHTRSQAVHYRLHCSQTSAMLVWWFGHEAKLWRTKPQIEW